MISPGDLDHLQAYLDGELPVAEAAAVELRLKTEPELAEQLLYLSRSEAVIAEWARNSIKADQIIASAGSVTPLRQIPSYRQGSWWFAAAAVLVMAIGAALWKLPRPTQATPLATLEAVNGTVRIIRSGADESAHAGQPLIAGDGLQVVGDDASAVVVYGDGTRLELGGDTTVFQFTGSDATGKEIVLASGSLRADVAKQPAGLPMILRTPQAEVTVLGTRFDLSGAGDATYVETAEGAVRLTRARDGRTVDVPAGFEARIDDSNIGARASPSRLTRPRFSTPGFYLTTSLTPDGKTLATSRFGSGEVTLWNVGDGTQWRSFDTQAAEVAAMSFSPDGQSLVTGGSDGLITVWNVESARSVIKFNGPTGLQALQFADEGRTLLALTFIKQNAMRLHSWDLATATAKGLPHDHAGGIWSFAASGRLLAMGSATSRQVIVSDTATGDVRFTSERFPDRIAAVGISPDESIIAIADLQARVTLWNIATGELLKTFLPGGRPVCSLVFSSDGTRLAMGQRLAILRVLELASGQQIAVLESPRDPASAASVRTIFFTPDGRTLATTESQGAGTVRLWDLPK